MMESIGMRVHMKIRMLAIVGGLGLLTAACNDPAPAPAPEPAPAPVEVAPPEPEPAPAPTPVATPSAADARPVDTSALPPDHRNSEETVQPESETLFY